MIADNLKVVIGGTDFTAMTTTKVTEVDLPIDRETHDNTGFGDTTKSFELGLKNWTGSISMNADNSAGGADEVLWGLFDAGTRVAIEITEDKDVAVSASNPKWVADAFITNAPSISGSVGEKRTVTINLVPASGGVNGPNLQRITV